jgi:large repetitive protein
MPDSTLETTPGRALPRLARIRRAGLGVPLALAAVLALTPASARAALPLAVNDTADVPDRNIGDGVCATAQNRCTLRAAIQESNALLGQDTINLPPGTYELEIPTVNEDSPTSGDHDITDLVNIVGAGAGTTIVDGGFPLQGAQIEARGIDRLFEVHPSAGSVTFRGMTIREGFSADDGGAIQNWSPGLLRVENVHVLDSFASKDGGGVNNGDPNDYEWTSETEPLTPIPSGRVEVVNSRLAGNSAGGLGAAINNVSNGTVSILSSQVVDNPGLMIPDPEQIIDPLDPEPIEYVPGPGVYDPVASAIVNKGEFLGVGTIRIVDSTVARNYAPPDAPG